ncbi:MAG: ATP-grasp domain-containing protein [Acidaminococcaceae bacterium]|nr:ATP-grasp domain-containing protein [Acidaminococcaceae bacterium]
MKTLMIVGAGKSQVPLIQAAKKEKYHTVVCDIDVNAPGVALADEYYKVSTKDRFALFEVAKRRRIDGIVANSEYAMCDIAFIANSFGLVGNPERSISILSSKSEFRKLQRKAGLFAPNYLYGDSIEKWNDKSFNFPVVIKPDQSSGTRGTVIVRASDDYNLIKSSVFECSKISRNGKAIAEEYVPGSICTTIEGEIFIHKGKILWDGLFLTIRSKMAAMIPMTYVFPLHEEEERIIKLKEALSKAFCTANIVHGEYNIEMYFTDNDEPFIIEINPRQGGNELPKYVMQHCGIDYHRLLVTTSVGDDDYWNSLENNKRKTSFITHHMLYPRTKGVFKGLQIDDSLRNCIYNTQIDLNYGDEVNNTVDGSSCVGCVDLLFSNVEEQGQISSDLEKLIKIEIEQGQTL